MTNDRIQKVKVLERGLAKIMECLNVAMEDATHRWHVEDILTYQVDVSKFYGSIAVLLSDRTDDHKAEELYKNIANNMLTFEDRVAEIMNVSQCLTKPETITILEDQVAADIKFADNMDHMYKVYMVANAHFDDMIKTYENYTRQDTLNCLMKSKINKFAEDFALIMNILIKASESTEDIEHFTPHGASVLVKKHKIEWDEWIEKHLENKDLATSNLY